MEKAYPVWMGTERCGTLCIKQEGLYCVCHANFSAQAEQIFRLYLMGEHGSIRLGTAEWTGKEYCLSRKISLQRIASLGETFSAVLGTTEDDTETEREHGWLALEAPEYFFSIPCPQLKECLPCYWRAEKGGRGLAVAWDAERAFPLSSLACFARVETLFGQPFLVWHIDQNGEPFFP